MPAAVASGFTSESLKGLMKKCQENLNKLARDYKRLTQNNKEVERLTREREQAIQQVSQEYEVRINQARYNAPEIGNIRQEIKRQVDSFKGFKETLTLIGFPDAAKIELRIPEEIKDLAMPAPPAPARGGVHPDITRLPVENFKPYRTIEASMKEMFEETGNEPMKPRQIIKYLSEVKKVPQAEASIRTQLHTLKNENKVAYDEGTKMYQWNFTEAEKRNLKREFVNSR